MELIFKDAKLVLVHLEGEAQSRDLSTTRLSRKYGDSTHFPSEIPFSLDGNLSWLASYLFGRRGPPLAPHQCSAGASQRSAGATLSHTHDLAEALHPLACFILLLLCR